MLTSALLCLYAEAEKECLTNPVGSGYSGIVQYSTSGKMCEYWSKTPDYLGVNLRDVSTDEAQNYCRRLPGSNWAQPSCLVSTSFGSRMRIEPCNIQYCGGETVIRTLLHRRTMLLRFSYARERKHINKRCVFTHHQSRSAGAGWARSQRIK